MAFIGHAKWSPDMSGWPVSCVFAFVLMLMGGTVYAEGNVRFGGGVPAVTDNPNQPAVTSSTALPGINRATLAPVTSLESEQAINNRILPADINQPQTSDTSSNNTNSK